MERVKREETAGWSHGGCPQVLRSKGGGREGQPEQQEEAGSAGSGGSRVQGSHAAEGASEMGMAKCPLGSLTESSCPAVRQS